MKTIIFTEDEIPPVLDQAIKSGLCHCFPADAAIFSTTRAWHGSAAAWSVVIMEEDLVAAHLGIVARTIIVEKKQIKAAGIQNVFVLPEYRGQGLCDMLMATAMKEAKRRNFDVGLLFCLPVLEKTYTRCGWHLVPQGKIIRTNENGKTCSLPSKNVTMFFPLLLKDFPPGSIDLQGNDW